MIQNFINGSLLPQVMTQPYKRSRTLRRVKVKLPGNRVTIHYGKRKPKLGSCHITGQSLKGVPRYRSRDMHNLPKSKKRPSRPYGGVLSSQAMRDVFKAKARLV